MASIVSKEQVPYRVWNKASKVWNELKFLTTAKSVNAADGKTLETKVGAVDGITSDINGTSTNIAASIKVVNSLNSTLKYCYLPDITLTFKQWADKYMTVNYIIDDLRKYYFYANCADGCYEVTASRINTNITGTAIPAWSLTSLPSYFFTATLGGADTVLKKLNDNPAVNPSLLYSIGDMSNAALTYTYTATDATEYVLFVALNDIQTFSTTGTLLYAVDTSSWQEGARSYGTTRIVKLSKGQSITVKARYTLEFVRLA